MEDAFLEEQLSVLFSPEEQNPPSIPLSSHISDLQSSNSDVDRKNQVINEGGGKLWSLDFPLKASCNMLSSWLTFLSYWYSNIAVDGSVKMERHLSALLFLRRREGQICRNADMVRAVLYDFIVRVLLYLKIGQYMTNSSTLCTVTF